MRAPRETANDQAGVGRALGMHSHGRDELCRRLLEGKWRRALLDGLQSQKTRVLSVPMVENGAVQGYIVARFVYTVEATTMRQLAVPPEPYVVDEAFRRIYADERLDFRKLARYDLSILTGAIKQRVNERMQAEIVQDVLIEDFNYVSREEFQRKP
jgi:hypothetical protein